MLQSKLSVHVAQSERITSDSSYNGLQNEVFYLEDENENDATLSTSNVGDYDVHTNSVTNSGKRVASNRSVGNSSGSSSSSSSNCGSNGDGNGGRSQPSSLMRKMDTVGEATDEYDANSYDFTNNFSDTHHDVDTSLATAGTVGTSAGSVGTKRNYGGHKIEEPWEKVEHPNKASSSSVSSKRNVSTGSGHSNQGHNHGDSIPSTTTTTTTSNNNNNLLMNNSRSDELPAVAIPIGLNMDAPELWPFVHAIDAIRASTSGSTLWGNTYAGDMKTTTTTTMSSSSNTLKATSTTDELIHIEDDSTTDGNEGVNVDGTDDGSDDVDGSDIPYIDKVFPASHSASKRRRIDPVHNNNHNNNHDDAHDDSHGDNYDHGDCLDFSNSYNEDNSRILQSVPSPSAVSMNVHTSLSSMPISAITNVSYQSSHQPVRRMH